MLSTSIKINGKTHQDVADMLREIANEIGDNGEQAGYMSWGGEQGYSFVTMGCPELPPPMPEEERKAAVRAELRRLHDEKWPDATYYIICPHCSGGDLFVSLTDNGCNEWSIRLEPNGRFKAPVGSEYNHVVCADCDEQFHLEELHRDR